MAPVPSLLADLTPADLDSSTKVVKHNKPPNLSSALIIRSLKDVLVVVFLFKKKVVIELAEREKKILLILTEGLCSRL